MTRRIIDVSHHNEVSDFSNVEFDAMMIRVQYGTKPDKKRDEFINYCENANIPYGFYIYSYALTAGQAKKEIATFKKFLESRNWKMPLLPVAFDFEDADNYKQKHGYDIWAEKKKNTEICDVACHAIEGLGCYAMIYASDAVFQKALNLGQLQKYDKWVARWSANKPETTYGMWQFTSEYLGRHLDCSVSDRDYPTIISKMYGKGGYESSQNASNLDLKVGDKVMLKSLIDYTGTKLADWTLEMQFEIIQIKGDRVVIGQNGKVTAAMHKIDLRKV